MTFYKIIVLQLIVLYNTFFSIVHFISYSYQREILLINQLKTLHFLECRVFIIIIFLFCVVSYLAASALTSFSAAAKAAFSAATRAKSLKPLALTSRSTNSIIAISAQSP